MWLRAISFARVERPEHVRELFRQILGDQADAEACGGFAVQPCCSACSFKRVHALGEQPRDHAGEHVVFAGFDDETVQLMPIRSAYTVTDPDEDSLFDGAVGAPGEGSGGSGGRGRWHKTSV